MTVYTPAEQRWLDASRDRRLGRSSDEYPEIGSLIWLVLRIKPNARHGHVDRAYPFDVEGRIIDNGTDRGHFHWRVPSIDDPAYVITTAAVVDLVDHFDVKEAACPASASR